MGIERKKQWHADLTVNLEKYFFSKLHVRSFRSFQHSDPYCKTDFTLLLKILSFVLLVIL